MSRAPSQESVASLRLPVPFFDLLMVLLVTCLVFVAPVQPENDVRAVDIPIAQGQGGSVAASLLPVVPKRTGQSWTFNILGEERAVALDALAARASADNRKVVLVVSPATPLQDFVGMQAMFAKANVPFALAVQNKETLP
jgi:biopolymer transport protein ExbD